LETCDFSIPFSINCESCNISSPDDATSKKDKSIFFAFAFSTSSLEKLLEAMETIVPPCFVISNDFKIVSPPSVSNTKSISIET
jgi:hypothetical protein